METTLPNSRLVWGIDETPTLMGLLRHDTQGLTQGINPGVHQLKVGYGPRLSAPWNAAHPGTAATRMKLLECNTKQSS